MILILPLYGWQKAESTLPFTLPGWFNTEMVYDERV